MTELGDLAQAVRLRRSQLDQEAGAAQAIARQREAADARVEALEHQVSLHEQAVNLLTSIGETHQEAVRRQVEELASRAMQVIFGEELTFHLVAGERAGQATLEFMVRSKYGNTQVDTQVLEARGGGMASVLGFVMRLVVLLLTPGARRVLFLDESFSFVSSGYEERVAEFLHEVAHKAQVQIVLITHSTAYSGRADKKHKFEASPKGVTQVFEGESE